MATKKKTSSTSTKVIASTEVSSFKDAEEKVVPKIKERWLKALTSDKYKQAKGVLCKTAEKSNKVVGHCCLGVLCDLYKNSAVNVGNLKWQKSCVKDDHLTFAGETTALPGEICSWAGFIDSSPSLKIELIWDKYEEKFKKVGMARNGRLANGMVSLAELNDFGFTFKQIAKIIKDHM